MFYRFSYEEKALRNELFACVNGGRRAEAIDIMDGLPRNSAILEELLEKAIRDNNVDLLELVVLRIDDINKKRFFWLRTAANLSAEMDRPECLIKLVQLNADLNVDDNDGETPILKICGKNGNCTTLQDALGARPTWESSIPFVGYVDLLWTSGYNINHKNKEGANAAIISVQHGNTHLLLPLARRGIDLECRDKRGNCAIHYAVMNNKPDAVQELLTLGVDVNCAQLGTGDTPAHLAIMHPGPDHKYECLYVLVRNGADLSKVNSNYSSAIMFHVTFPLSAAELAAVQRSKGYIQAHEVISDALSAGMLPKPTAIETSLASVGSATTEGLVSVGEHVTWAASSTADVFQSTAESTGSVLMLPISSLASFVTEK